MHRRDHERRERRRTNRRDAAVTLNGLPSSACAAVAPRQTMTRGLTSAISVSSHGRQAAISPRVRLLVDPALAARLPLEVLDDVGDVDRPRDRCRPPRSARSSSLPAGPTNGWPARSSASPGCSPTSISRARRAPSPNTVCVPRFHRSHAAAVAASRTFGSVGRSGAVPDRSAGLLAAPVRQHQLLDRPRDMLERRSVAGRLLVSAAPRCSVRRRCCRSRLPVRRSRLRRELIALPAAARAARRPTSTDRAAAAIQHRPRLPRRVVAWTAAATAFHGQTSWQMSQPYTCVPIAGAMRAGNVAPQLDRQVRNAARRIEHAGRDQRLRRARLEAQRAGAALIERRRVDLERQAADDLARGTSTIRARVDDAGVLADPADAGVLRVDALLHRPGVDVGARLERLAATRSRIQRDQRVEPSPITSW